MIINGDARALPLPDASVDAIVTDPPYGTGAGCGYGRRQLGCRTIGGDEDLSTLAAALPEMLRVLRRPGWVVAFASPRREHEQATLMEASSFNVLGIAVWNKRQPSLGFPVRYAHESIVISYAGDTPPVASHALISVLGGTVNRNEARRRHVHAKPVAVLATLVEWACAEGGVVLDPFCGSGSTGVACVETGRRFIGVEIDPRWAEVARRREMEAVPTLLYSPHYAQQEIA